MRRRLPGASDLHPCACGMRSDDSVELHAAPAFAAGDKVRSRQRIRNDGSYLGKQIGETLVDAGETGYVRLDAPSRASKPSAFKDWSPRSMRSGCANEAGAMTVMPAPGLMAGGLNKFVVSAGIFTRPRPA